jgi:hypothetical protein
MPMVSISLREGKSAQYRLRQLRRYVDLLKR